MVKSEFGRGYATCLFQFTRHRARLEEWIELYAKIHDESEPGFMTPEMAVEIWANGATDHLYDLIRPFRGVPRSEWRIAQGIQTRGLKIGHTFALQTPSTPAEAQGLLDAATHLLIALEQRGYPVDTLEHAMETDRALGLAPESGTWSCSENITMNQRFRKKEAHA